ncbi:exported hypothetical protein [Agrobacterium genomosp. 5 str. CFBP 6626]|nr:exported hypothetical protein [Agrobacterium genomosp. 5 str. CFBP 6626]
MTSRSMASARPFASSSFASTDRLAVAGAAAASRLSRCCLRTGTRTTARMSSRRFSCSGMIDSFEVSRVEMGSALSRKNIAADRIRADGLGNKPDETGNVPGAGQLMLKIPSQEPDQAAPSSLSNICIGWPGMMVEIACL